LRQMINAVHDLIASTIYYPKSLMIESNPKKYLFLLCKKAMNISVLRWTHRGLFLITVPISRIRLKIKQRDNPSAIYY